MFDEFFINVGSCIRVAFVWGHTLFCRPMYDYEWEMNGYTSGAQNGRTEALIKMWRKLAYPIEILFDLLRTDLDFCHQGRPGYRNCPKI
jgi:hypothetical protein